MTIQTLTVMQGVTIGAVITIPSIAQDVASRIAEPIIEKISRDSLRTLAEFGLRLTVCLITSCATAYAVSMPYLTALTINALFISAIFVYTRFFGNSFQDDWKEIDGNYRVLEGANFALQGKYNTLKENFEALNNKMESSAKSPTEEESSTLSQDEINECQKTLLDALARVNTMTTEAIKSEEKQKEALSTPDGSSAK